MLAWLHKILFGSDASRGRRCQRRLSSARLRARRTFFEPLEGRQLMAADLAQWDFGKPAVAGENPSTLEAGYTRVTPGSVFGEDLAGWDDAGIVGAGNQDPSSLGPLKRDFNHDNERQTFRAQLTQGLWDVRFIAGHHSAAITNMQIAIGNTPAINVNTAAGQYVDTIHSASYRRVLVGSDGILPIAFDDTDASGKLWAIQAITATPVVTDYASSLIYYEEAPATPILASTTDVYESGQDYRGGALTVSYLGTSTTSGNDRLELHTNASTTGLSVTVDEGTPTVYRGRVSHNGVEFGSFSGGIGAEALVVTFTPEDEGAPINAAAVEALLRSVSFHNLNIHTLPSGTRNLRLELTSGSAPVMSETLTLQTVNDAPQVFGLTDQNLVTAPGLSPLSRTFYVQDRDTLLVDVHHSRSSSNQTLIPDANIELIGDGAERTVKITPAAGQTGTATITITVDDGNTQNATGTMQFTVTVNPPNAWHNGTNAYDVDGDGNVTTGDADAVNWVIINYPHGLSAPVGAPLTLPMLAAWRPDVNNDGFVNDLDAEVVYLKEGSGSGSGTPSGSSTWKITALDGSDSTSVSEPYSALDADKTFATFKAWYQNARKDGGSIDWETISPPSEIDTYYQMELSAVEGEDFEATGGPLTVPAGVERREFILKVPVKFDTEYEQPQRFEAVLGTPPAGWWFLGGQGKANATINDTAYVAPSLDLHIDADNDGTIDDADTLMEDTEPSHIMAFTEDGDKTGPSQLRINRALFSTAAERWSIALSFDEEVRLFKDVACTQQISSGDEHKLADLPETLYLLPNSAGSALIVATLENSVTLESATDSVNVSVVKLDLDAAEWTDVSEEPLEVNPGVIAPLDAVITPEDFLDHPTVGISSGTTSTLYVPTASAAGLPRPYVVYEPTKLVLSVGNTGGSVANGAQVDWGSSLVIQCFKRLGNSGAELSDQAEIRLVFPVGGGSLSDSVIVRPAALTVTDVPDFVFAGAEYALPIMFDALGVGSDVFVSDIAITLHEGTDSETNPLTIGSWDAGDRFVAGNGMTSTGSVARGNGTDDTYTAFVSPGGIASFVGKTANAWFSVSATVRPTADGPSVKISSPHIKTGIESAPKVVYGDDTAVIEFAASHSQAVDKTIDFNIDKTGESRFVKFNHNPAENSYSPVESSASELAQDNWYFTTASAQRTGNSPLTAYAELADHSTFGSSIKADAMSFSDQIGGYVYFSYGGRPLPGILGSSELAMAMDLDSGEMYTDIFEGSKVTTAFSDGANDSTAFGLTGVSGAAGIVWALAPAGGPIGMVAGVIASLAGLTAGAWGGGDPGSRAANAVLQPFSQYIAPNGSTESDGSYQPVTGVQNGTPFSMAGGERNQVEVGGAVCRYVVLASEVTVESNWWALSSNEASASIVLEAGTKPDALTKFNAKAWLV